MTMRIWILSIILLIAVLIEATFTTIPLSLLLLINFLVLEKKSWVFIAAFLTGLMLDILTLRFLASTGLFFIIFLYVINLYEKKFETANIYFVLFSSFLGAFLYLNIFKISIVLPQALISAILGVVIFYLFTLLTKEKNLDYKYRIDNN